MNFVKISALALLALAQYTTSIPITLSAEFETARFCDQYYSYLCDPYAEVWWSDDGIWFWRMEKTAHVPNTLNPVWPNVYAPPPEARVMRFEVWNYNYGQVDDYLGYNRVSVSALQNQIDNGMDWIGLDLIDPYGEGRHFGYLKVHILNNTINSNSNRGFSLYSLGGPTKF